MKKNPSPIQEIEDTLLKEAKIRLFIKREDLNHPTIQGNKYWKLLYNIQEAKKQEKNQLITFGGAFSNHIYATAAAGKAFRFKTIGIIRGERIEPLNYTLSSAENFGMQLHFISRAKYKEKNNPVYQKELLEQFGDSYIIPEGGTNHFAIQGCQALAEEIKNQGKFNQLCLPVGTGGTIAGLISAYDSNVEIVGFSSLKGKFLTGEIEELLQGFSGTSYSNWSINNDYHFGGYAKKSDELIQFINNFKRQYQISLDPIYTGKMIYGIFDMAKKNLFKNGTSILAIHTGGLQGIVGFNKRFGNIIS